ncbi:MAG: diguanylate cyclase [Gallionella sp.]
MSLDTPKKYDENSYRFSDLLDVAAFARLLDKFYRATGIPNGVVDADGELLCMSSGSNACAVFHRTHLVAAKRCRESNLELMRNLHGGCVTGRLCQNGLMDYATPVVIEGRQLATLFLGQILHTPPDLRFFRAQAAQLGFDETSYLASIAAIPVVDKQRVDDLMNMMVEMAQILAASGLARLRQVALERDVSVHAERSIQLKDILDFAPFAMIWSEDEERIEYVNRQFTQLFGYTLDDLPNLETWYRRAYPDDHYRETVVGNWRKAVSAAQLHNMPPPELEANITCKDGTMRAIMVYVAWVGHRQMVGFSDITERKRLENVLLRSKKMLADAQKIAKIGSWDWDVVEGRVEWSEMAYEIYTPDKYPIDPSFEDFKSSLHPDDLERVASAVQLAFEQDVPFDLDHRVVSVSKGVRTVHAQGSVFRDMSGKPVRMVGTVQDISERKQMEDMLRASEARTRDHATLLQAVLESSPEVIVFALDRDYHYLAFNEKHRATMYAIWGKEIAIGVNMLAVIGAHPDREKARQGFDRALAGEAFITEDAYGDEAILRLYWQNFFAPIRGGDGAIIGLTCFVLNITERKRVERMLVESEHKFRTLAEHLPDVVVRYDLDARFVYVNPRFESVLGFRSDEVLGKTPTQVAGLPDAAYFEQMVRQVTQTGTELSLESEIATSNGGAFYGLIRGTLELDDAGQVEFIQVVIRDITERRRAEQRMQAHDSMLEMVARDAGLTVILNALVTYMESEDKTSLCSIMLADAEVTHLFSTAAPTLPTFYVQAINGIEIKVGVGSCCTAAALGERVIVEDIMTHEYWAAYRQLAQEAGLRACWSEPILSSKGKVLGTFATYHTEPRSPEPHDLERIVFATNLAAVTIENRQVHDELERQAHSDYLTGLDNRRHFLNQAENELTRTVRYDRQLSILMIDIDHFKLVNDTYGHKVGDIVLQRFAAVCLATLRTVDIIGRIGGEEFAVLLPETAREQACDVAERLRAALAATQVKLDSGLPLQFTVSIGIVSLNEKDTNIDILLNQADQALYRAKSEGRNQVCLYQA